jgi:hypothetical protein
LSHRARGSVNPPYALLKRAGIFTNARPLLRKPVVNRGRASKEGLTMKTQVKRLKLYHSPAVRSARVKWLLHELMDDDFDVEVVALLDADQYRDEFLRMNPNHAVPVLEITMENGEVLHMIESGAMVALLADTFPDKKLAPSPHVFFTGARGLSANAPFRRVIHGHDAVAAHP